MDTVRQPPELSNRIPPWSGADLVRVMRLVQQIYDLGPRSLFEIFLELAADSVVRLDLDVLLPRYARLDPAMVDALDARDLKPPMLTVMVGADDLVDEDEDDQVDRRAA